MNTAIARQRLANQWVSRPEYRTPEDVIAWLGAVQAQEYALAKWALGLRMVDGTTDAQIERALNEGRILRTHVMRPTWHFVTSSDIHWMLELTAPRVHQAMAYGHRQFGLDTAIRRRAARKFERALRDGACLTRAELGSQLASSSVAIKGVPLGLLTIYAELEGVICSGPRRGKQPTYALLASRAPRMRKLSRDEALAELTARYFRSHGPATVRDYVWWSGLTTADARRGLEMNNARREEIDGLTYWTVAATPAGRATRARVHLLPIYDEYLVAYRDLDAVPRNAARFGVLPQALVVDGEVAGTWKITPHKDGYLLHVTASKQLIETERPGLARAVLRYARFLQKPVTLATPEPVT